MQPVLREVSHQLVLELVMWSWSPAVPSDPTPAASQEPGREHASSAAAAVFGPFVRDPLGRQREQIYNDGSA